MPASAHDVPNTTPQDLDGKHVVNRHGVVSKFKFQRYFGNYSFLSRLSR